MTDCSNTNYWLYDGGGKFPVITREKLSFHFNSQLAETLEEFNGRRANEVIASKKQNQNFENVVGELQGNGIETVQSEVIIEIHSQTVQYINI